MKTKTKKQAKPEPIGRVMWANPAHMLEGLARICGGQLVGSQRSYLVIPMTVDGKCQHDDVLFVLGKAIAANGDDCYAAAAAVLTHLGWPETKGGK